MARFSGVSTGTVPTYTNVLVTQTLPKIQPQIVDNFFDATPFWWWLKTKNRIISWDGGDTMETPVLYQEALGARAYQTYEVMDTHPPRGVTTAIWGLSHYRIPMMYARTTADANKGESQIINLVETLRDQVSLSLTRYINTDLFSESAQDPVKLNSMYHLLEENVEASQAQIVGGISKASYSWWRHKYAAITSASAGILSAIRDLHMQCSDGADKPDFCVCDDYTYINIENKLQTAVRFVNPDAADWGFENIAYKGLTITFDKSINDDSHNGDGDGTLFMLNTRYFKAAFGAANFRVIPPEYDLYQDAYVGATLVDLQTFCTGPRRQGVLKGGAYSLAC